MASSIYCMCLAECIIIYKYQSQPCILTCAKLVCQETKYKNTVQMDDIIHRGV